MSNVKENPTRDDTKEEETTFDYDSSGNSGPDDDSFCFEGKNNDDVTAARFDSSELKLRSYKILKEADIKQRIEEDVSEISFVLCISKSEASILLCHYNWSVSKVNDAWFADEDEVRQKVGLILTKQVSIDDDVCSEETKIVTCGFCAESYSSDRIRSASCGHPYCNVCLSRYLSNSINNDEFECLKLRCPDPTCSAAISPDMIESLVSVDDRKKYSDYLVESYIEENRKINLCVGRYCKYAVEFFGDINGSNFDVTCDCQTSFCWNCGGESHHPLDCKTLRMWNLEFSKYERYLWPANVCPNSECMEQTEQLGGPIQMSCTKCYHEYCGLCLGSSKNHQKYCNRTNIIKKDCMDRLTVLQYNRNKFKFYHQRWAAHRRSKLTATADHHESKYDLRSFRLIAEAWKQVIEGRRVLQWSYVFGYYLPDNIDPSKKLYFECLQGVSETNIGKLHLLVEKELKQKQFLPTSELSPPLSAELHELTIAARNYSDKFIREMENWLSNLSFQYDVEDSWVCNLCTYANPLSVLRCDMCLSSCNATSEMKEDDENKATASQADADYAQLSIFDE